MERQLARGGDRPSFLSLAMTVHVRCQALHTCGTSCVRAPESPCASLHPFCCAYFYSTKHKMCGIKLFKRIFLAGGCTALQHGYSALWWPRYSTGIDAVLQQGGSTHGCFISKAQHCIWGNHCTMMFHQGYVLFSVGQYVGSCSWGAFCAVAWWRCMCHTAVCRLALALTTASPVCIADFHLLRHGDSDGYWFVCLWLLAAYVAHHTAQHAIVLHQ